MMKRFFPLLLALSACTGGGISPGSAGGAATTNVTRIDVSIAAYGSQPTSAGPALGFSPASVSVAVGDGIQFVNVDNTSHTASSFAGTSFPASSPLTFSATTQAGATLSGGWSSGTLQAGASSAVILADKPGTYLYGCFFHYSGNMRGVIVAH